MTNFNEIFPTPESQCGSIYRLKPWKGHYMYAKYEDRIAAMGSIWSLAFANFVASHMELVSMFVGVIDQKNG